MDRNITFKGNPLTLAGRVLKLEEIAPDFKVNSGDLAEISLGGFKDKIKIINTFPSLDTPVCDLQIKEFNQRATGLSADVVVLGISKDLPFAQKRFCESFEIKNVQVFSDYKTTSFGINYGLLIKELNLLARAAMIIDKNDILRYLQIAPELTKPLDYEEVLKNLEKVIKDPSFPVKQKPASKCVPCEGKISPMSGEVIAKILPGYPGWELINDRKLAKEFKFKDFPDAKYFLDLISVIAQEQGHHAMMTVIFNMVKITLTTYAAAGLTENDFIMANLIDSLKI